MDTEAVAAWLDGYSQAWGTYDPEQIGALFSTDAVYFYDPFTEPLRGREAIVADWLADRDEAGTYEGSYRPVLVAGDEAVARGYSRYFNTNGTVRDEYDNLFLLRFDADGRCAEYREWYMKKPKPEGELRPALQPGCNRAGHPDPGDRAHEGVAEMTSLLADVVAREPLAAADGRSGSLLERVVLADGRALVVKHVRDGGDWIMRASHDHGRAAELWSSGVLARVPDVIDHAVVGAERVEDGWVVIMRDVSAALVPDHARLTRGDSRRVLEAAAALHARFWDDPPLDLCSMVDRYRFLSPATARREAGGDDEVPG